MTLAYVTSNPLKFQIAQNVLSKFGVELEQIKIETPEIQSTQVEEIAKYSARYAADLLQKPVIVTDAGWYFEGLNGFPGPFVKYLNHWLTTTQILNLMEKESNRKVNIIECVAYCEPGQDPNVLLAKLAAKLTT